jgi:EpsI family protein
MEEVPVQFPQLAPHGAVSGLRLLMNSSNRMEAVSYWIRVGHDYPRGGLDTRLTILKAGLAGVVPDAVLVRASSILTQAEESASAYARQERFLAEMVQAMRPEGRPMVVAQ